MNTPLCAQPSSPSETWTWDVFCHVIDNFGDVGVCWRLCRDLAERGHRVRLWVDDASALSWMAPEGHPRVQVLPWNIQNLASMKAPADVVVEAFGCAIPEAFKDRMAESARPAVWINLEYFSAEAYVERSHGLPSPQRTAKGHGLDKWFFYPGLTQRTGGLLREPDLAERRARFDRDAWLQTLGVRRRPQERVVSLFCYPGAPVNALVTALRKAFSMAPSDEPILILAAPGAAQEMLAHEPLGAAAATGSDTGTALRWHALPWLSQREFDHLLWSADLNFVRGEDSLVRAMWAQVPFVWQIYPQHDGVHADKLQAFLTHMCQGVDRPLAQSIQRLMLQWNGLPFGQAAPADPPIQGLPPLRAWQTAIQKWVQTLMTQQDLTSQLTAFVRQRRTRVAVDENP
ncbi:MAG: elongation factor P maturation arginine rhamnosyltransferase EarP [Betaproteobacteria bacterium]|nr:elongation factor P maturation arginine rhamnosyltransferase EarP [Betaproteobacteria bacterium]